MGAACSTVSLKSIPKGRKKCRRVPFTTEDTTETFGRRCPVCLSTPEPFAESTTFLSLCKGGRQRGRGRIEGIRGSAVLPATSLRLSPRMLASESVGRTFRVPKALGNEKFHPFEAAHLAEFRTSRPPTNLFCGFSVYKRESTRVGTERYWRVGFPLRYA